MALIYYYFVNVKNALFLYMCNVMVLYPLELSIASLIKTYTSQLSRLFNSDLNSEQTQYICTLYKLGTHICVCTVSSDHGIVVATWSYAMFSIKNYEQNLDCSISLQGI